MNKLLKIPSEFIINKNDLYTEESEFDFEEDILQLELKSKNLTIDLGWYGNADLKDGIYKIFLIGHSNWEEPLIIIESKSKEDISTKLEKLITTISLEGFTA